MTHDTQIKEAKERLSNSPWHIEPWMGMVRASFGLYNTTEDIDVLISALSEIINNKSTFSNAYSMNADGDYKHKEFTFSSKDFFSLTGTIDQDIISK